MKMTPIREIKLSLIALAALGLQACLGGGGSEESKPVAEQAQPKAPEVHIEYFSKSPYDGTSSCLKCHEDAGNHVMMTGHWKWQGEASKVDEHGDHVHGKNDMINNFCIAVPSNEGRCTQCHTGYGYADKNFDFGKAEGIDCLICHDQSGTYRKAPKTAGLPEPDVDLLRVARSVGKNDGIPQRANCISCHAKAGGGDNVKHGDLSTAMIATTREFDVHMGTNGANMSCVACHNIKRTQAGDPVDHGIGGMPFHSVDEGSLKQCADCHGDNTQAHQNKEMGELFVNKHGQSHHERLACQTCHIPSIARQVSTKTEWDWSTAGDAGRVPVLDADGRPDYDKMKGSFVWEKSVRPVLRAHNGEWQKMMIGENDKHDGAPSAENPVILASPAAAPNDADAKIYPFKLMTGKQIADANNNTMLVPHLFGMAGGDHPYWKDYDWGLALEDGADYTGQTYTGAYEFVETEMLLSVNHEVPPGAMALGKGGECADCHGGDQIDWPALGHAEDPYHPGAGGDD